MATSRLSQRAQLVAARLVGHLPDRIKIRLSGEPSVIVDGQQLDPQLQFLRSVSRRRRVRGLIEPSIAAGRERYRRETRAFRGPTTTVAEVRDFDIPGPTSSLRVRHYAPLAAAGDAPAPLTVYLHGGGFVIGDLDTHDEPSRILCRHAGVHVLSVEYRLAPEHPFPAAVDDAREAFAWARTHAASLGADPGLVAIAGDSAGANLATVVSHLTSRDPHGPVAQLLIYPATDIVTERRSHRLFGDGFFLTMADCEAFFRCYTGGAGARDDDPRLSPLLADDLSKLPPALIVTAGFDPLRDEGDAYAHALESAGTSVRVHRFPGLGHGFIHMTGVCPAARQAMLAIARGWRVLMSPPISIHPSRNTPSPADPRCRPDRPSRG
jgi:acetyl esterase